MKKNESCGCGVDLKAEVKGIVNQVEGYSKTDHELKGREVRAAFAEKKTAEKPASDKK
ncbi:MAG: hypothetical protein LBM63_01490 [Rikenellaceae bacterium]|jgi:hypothetical protein|nr:hypothetical protein [Rikenellaceae bacterium]